MISEKLEHCIRALDEQIGEVVDRRACRPDRQRFRALMRNLGAVLDQVREMEARIVPPGARVVIGADAVPPNVLSLARKLDRLGVTTGAPDLMPVYGPRPDPDGQGGAS